MHKWGLCRAKGGWEEGCLSFSCITMDTHRHIVYVLSYFVFVSVYLYLLYYMID